MNEKIYNFYNSYSLNKTVIFLMTCKKVIKWKRNRHTFKPKCKSKCECKILHTGKVNKKLSKIDFNTCKLTVIIVISTNIFYKFITTLSSTYATKKKSFIDGGLFTSFQGLLSLIIKCIC